MKTERTSLHLRKAVAISGLLLGSLFLTPEKASAVSITGSQTGPSEWTYDLTFAPLDNYSIFQQFTTITLTGLSGVTGAAGPTSTDFDPPGGSLDINNLDWTVAVLDGGTKVQWTHDGSGTGNFGVDKHIFGFLVFANGVDGLVSVATDGVSRDTSNPLPDGTFDLDISALVAGPIGAAVSIPPVSWLFVAGLLGLAGARKRGRT
jgi:hypothetical protein